MINQQVICLYCN